MKKLSIIFMSLVIAFSAFSQEDEGFSQENTGTMRNKKGKVILPEQGEIGIEISASPFLSYVGNMFNGAVFSPAVFFKAENPAAMSLKYVFTENMIIRGTLEIGSTSSTVNTANLSDAKVFDKTTTSFNTFGLSAGVQILRPIKGRLVGYYGGTVGFKSTPDATGKVTFKDAKDNKNDYVVKGGKTSEIYLGGVIGVEYFVAPKISLGGEFMLKVGFGSTSEKEVVFKNNSDSDKVLSEKSSSRSISTTPSGAITASFYF